MHGEGATETGQRNLAPSGEDFLYCVKAAGFASGSAASGRACGLRPVPPCTAPHGNASASSHESSFEFRPDAEAPGEPVQAVKPTNLAPQVHPHRADLHAVKVRSRVSPPAHHVCDLLPSNSQTVTQLKSSHP